MKLFKKRPMLGRKPNWFYVTYQKRRRDKDGNIRMFGNQEWSTIHGFMSSKKRGTIEISDIKMCPDELDEDFRIISIQTVYLSVKNLYKGS